VASESRSTDAAAPERPTGAPDADSRRWLAALAGEGPDRADAVSRLHELLLRAARFKVFRLGPMLPSLSAGDLDDIVQQSADDALVAVLGKLHDYRGESRFTTWAYKFALYEAGVKLRRRAWRKRELPLEPEGWPPLPSERPSPHEEAERGELLRALTRKIDEALTDRQREVLVAITLNGVPIDVLAERFDTTRGALYKTLHDARKKLRRELTAEGFDVAAAEVRQVR
jgi:RNA polymerase sigma-70 factor (ECF subfamily)